MKNRICCLIIDSNSKEHNYDTIKSYYINDHAEQSFDFIIENNTDNIKTVLNDNRGIDAIITIGNEVNTYPLNILPFEWRKKWIHLNVFDEEAISSSIIATFTYNINREIPDEVKLFSIFTPIFNSSTDSLYRLYQSLVKQTYREWNWWILDDGTNDSASRFLQGLCDSRITIIKNVTNHASIGFNKHIIAMACDGEYLVEVDHDDELTEDCLELLHKAFVTYPDCDFVYSDCLESINGEAIFYGDGFSLGQGFYRKETVNGKEYNVAITTPSINCKSIRMIYAEPNHVRCWKKEFYHRIGGHNTELSVLDDMDLIIRTFLYGKMCHINKVLYIQYEDGDRGNTGTNTQSKRFSEIQRTNYLLYDKYDKLIHNRIIELGYKDSVWNEESNSSSFIYNDNVQLDKMNYEL